MAYLISKKFFNRIAIEKKIWLSSKRIIKIDFHIFMMRFFISKTHHKNEKIDFYDAFYYRIFWTKSEKVAPDTSAMATTHRSPDFQSHQQNGAILPFWEQVRRQRQWLF